MEKDPCGGIKYNGHTYYINPNLKKTRDGTVGVCQQGPQAHLANVESQEERLFIQSMLHQLDKDQSDHYYIGNIGAIKGS